MSDAPELRIGWPQQVDYQRIPADYQHLVRLLCGRASSFQTTLMKELRSRGPQLPEDESESWLVSFSESMYEMNYVTVDRDAADDLVLGADDGLSYAQSLMVLVRSHLTPEGWMLDRCLRCGLSSEDELPPLPSPN